METIITGSNYAISWYDDAQTIVLVEVQKQWSWEDATTVISTVDNIHLRLDYDAYAIYSFRAGTSVLPKGSALMHLRNSVTVDPPHQRLNVIINAGLVIETMLRIVFTANKLIGIESKYRFVRSLEAALQEIDHDKLKNVPVAQ